MSVGKQFFPPLQYRFDSTQILYTLVVLRVAKGLKTEYLRNIGNIRNISKLVGECQSPLLPTEANFGQYQSRTTHKEISKISGHVYNLVLIFFFVLLFAKYFSIVFVFTKTNSCQIKQISRIMSPRLDYTFYRIAI